MKIKHVLKTFVNKSADSWGFRSEGVGFFYSVSFLTGVHVSTNM